MEIVSKKCSEIYKLEDKLYAPYAMKSKYSRGRKYQEKEHSYRSIYQRDRDRIIHSAAFRRLEYKTQVFVYHEGDYYRTRLTHTLEVAQIARTIARVLGLNEELTEAISLAHDLGHTPFGHAVENVLNELIKDEGGFNHNHQGLRVVDFLEERYPNFKGLNLTWETREGIIRHSKNNMNAAGNQIIQKEFLDPQPTLEAQVMDVADEIAYDNHDLDDGLKSKMLEESELKNILLWRITEKKVKMQYTNLKQELKFYLIIRNLIDLEVTDLINTSAKLIKKFQISNFKDAKKCKHRLITFSDEILQMRKELKDFIFKNLYCHWRVLRMSDKAKRYIQALFTVYLNNPNLLPYKFQTNETIKRSICDYIAGMTDRYAIEEYKKLFDPDTKV